MNIPKKIFSFILITLLFINNCVAQSFAQKIIGKWSVTKLEQVAGGEKIDSISSKKSLNSTITFNADGSFSSAQFVNGVYKILGTGNYRISDDGKHLYQDDVEADILTFTEKDFAIQVKNIVVMQLSKMIDFTLPKQIEKVTITKTLTNADFTPIPNATLQLLSSKQILQSNERGNFSIDALLKDSITISSIGYKTKTFSAYDLIKMEDVILEDDKKVLQEVVVSNEKKKSIILNDFSSCGLSWYANNMHTPFYQMAQKLNTDIDNAFLKSIRICKIHRKTIFRIRIYDVDTLKFSPGKNLLDSFIEVSTAKRNVKLNLEKYNLRLPHHSFFIAIEWLFIEENKYTEKLKINGVKEKREYVSPEFSIRNWKVEDGDNKMWFLIKSFSDSSKFVWQQTSRSIALISAEITE